MGWAWILKVLRLRFRVMVENDPLKTLEHALTPHRAYFLLWGDIRDEVVFFRSLELVRSFIEDVFGFRNVPLPEGGLGGAFDQHADCEGERFGKP